MKITAIIENRSKKDGIGSEHGLCLYIETEKRRILFDMGQTELFSKNAAALGIDLSEVDIAVLSHGHYDHGGGLAKFLDINKKAPVYISKQAFLPYFNGTEKYIGLDISLKNSDRLVFTDDTYEIESGLTLFSCNGEKRIHDLGSFGLTEKTENGFIPDRFLHEQYLLIENSVLISGCSHKGILNIAKWFEPKALVGGFHFSKLPLDDTLKGYAEYLACFDTDFYTCHCTGEEQYEFMKKYMPRLNYISASDSIML